jgi:hypothetical protein
LGDVNSRAFTVGVAFATLFISGTGLARLIAPVSAELRRARPTLCSEDFASASGSSVLFAVFGGFPTWAADLAWMRLYSHWERCDWPASETLIRLVTALDPERVYFWLNGARMIAYDFPTWRILAHGGDQGAPLSLRTRIHREQAGTALRLLASAMKAHPANSELWIERANIELNRLGDVEAAAESYRRAWEIPGCPYYAARLHGQLLRQLGKTPEALSWLVRLHPSLPTNDPAAAADVVLQRIRELERELKVNAEKSYQAAE